MGVEEDYQKLPGNIDRKSFDNGKLKFIDYYSTPPMFFTKDMANVPCINRYANGHAFLIAGGPSFKNIDKNKLNKPGILTMGINNSSASFRPDLWTCVDSPSNFLASVWLDPKIEKIVPISHIDKKLFDSSKWRDTNVSVGDCPNVIYYRRNEVVDTEEYLFEDTINWGNHSNIGGGRSVFMAAIRILYILGIRNLYLLGVDFHMDEKTKYHFPQDRSRGSINGNMSTYNSMKKWFGELKEVFDEVGYKVYNCNKDSALKVFPYISFDDAFKEATKQLPNSEKTDGMYSRKDDEKKQKEVEEAKKIAQRYTDDDRIKIKEKLDSLRKELDNAKEEQHRILLEKFDDNAKQCFLWAHKLRRPENRTMAELYDWLKEASKHEIESDDIEDQFKTALYESQMEINRIRSTFKECNKRKNEIWGIVK